MSTAVHNPLEIQYWIVDFVLKRQAEAGFARDREIARFLEADPAAVRVHLELLAVEGRIEVERLDDGYRVRATEEQRARHVAPPPHVAARQRLERLSDRLERIRDGINRVVSWAPLALMIAGAVAGWMSAAPQLRTETAFYVGFAGLLVGVMLSRELVR